MHSMVFRAKPAQTQARSAAIELYKEGWPQLAQTTAEMAYSMWTDLGKACNIEQPESKLAQYKANDLEYKVKYKENAVRSSKDRLPNYLQKTPTQLNMQKALENFKAFVFMSNYERLRSTCRYDYWVDMSNTLH